MVLLLRLAFQRKNVIWGLMIIIDTGDFIDYNCFTSSVKRGVLMKLNLTEQQLVQLAQEQFRKLMMEIPFVTEVEFMLPTDLMEIWDLSAVVKFSDSKSILKFNIDVHSNGETRFVSRFIQRATQHNDDDCYVFVAPYISEASAKLLYDNYCSYLDLSGNCYILTRRIIIRNSGQPNKYVQLREKKNYFSKSSSAASAVMRTMLDQPDLLWQVKQLADLTGKAIGTVSNVKKFLVEQAWAEESVGGFRLRNIRELLYAWAKEYPKKDTRTLEYYSFDSIPQIESEISFCNSIRDTNAVLGGFSAAARYAPTVRYKKVSVYVEQNALDSFVKQLDLQPVSSGGNVIITVPHDETPCMFARKINGDLVTSPVQTVIDLLCSSGRGEEAAEAIILKEFIQER